MPPDPTNDNHANKMSTDPTPNDANKMAEPNVSSSSTSSSSSSTKSSIHSSLRVVTNPGELGVSFPPPGPFLPSAGGKWTPSMLRSPSGLLLSPLGLLAKSFRLDTPDAASSSASSSSSAAVPSSVLASSSIGFFDTASKELQFDPRFLAEAWSQESPQSVYALLGQPGALGGAFAGFSPLAASSPRLLSPMAMLHHSSAPPQSFLSHLQSPLLAMSPVGSMTSSATASSSSSSSTSTTTSTFYPPTVTIPPSPHALNPHLLSPMFATAVSPGGGLGVSPDMLSMIDPATVFVPPSSPSAILRHLLPPIMPRNAALNVKDLTLNELRPHFNKPMAVVAKELGVCITLMKKICRRNGLVRWPHRRIRSLVNRITSLQVIASTAVGAEKKRFQAQIHTLRDELSAVIQNPNEKSRKAQADAKARTPPLAALSISAPGPASAAVSRKRRATPTSDQGHDDDALYDDDEDDDDALYADENAPTQAKAASTSKRGASPSRALKKEPQAARATRARDKAAAARPAALASSTSVTGKRTSARFRSSAVPPPPIKIPRQSEFEAAKRAADAEFGERPSSTTSNGSCGKRGSISSILC